MVDCKRAIKNITLYMQDRDITNRRLCNDVGITQATWCNRKKNPKNLLLGEMAAICNYLGITLADLEEKKL